MCSSIRGAGGGTSLAATIVGRSRSICVGAGVSVHYQNVDENAILTRALLKSLPINMTRSAVSYSISHQHSSGTCSNVHQKTYLGRDAV